MAGHDDDDPGVWPAYVAAMSSLMQALLLVMAVMAIANMLGGQAKQVAASTEKVKLGGGECDPEVSPLACDRSGRGPGEGGRYKTEGTAAVGQAADAADSAERSAESAAGFGSGQMFGAAGAAATAAGGGSADPADAASPGGGKGGRTGAAGGGRGGGGSATLVANTGLRFAFQPEAVALGDGQVQQAKAYVDPRLKTGRWLLWAQADTQDTVARRGAFLRLMGLRAWLMQNGVSARAIDIELREGFAAQADAASGRIVFLEHKPESS